MKFSSFEIPQNQGEWTIQCSSKERNKIDSARLVCTLAEPEEVRRKQAIRLMVQVKKTLYT